MSNDKGQALVEFVLILPIFVIILFALIDFGTVLYKKYELENDLDYITDLYQNSETIRINNYLNDNSLNIQFIDEDKYTKIILTKDIGLITPGSNLVLNNPFTIKVQKVIYNE